jgi:hypothetical protein
VDDGRVVFNLARGTGEQDGLRHPGPEIARRVVRRAAVALAETAVLVVWLRFGVGDHPPAALFGAAMWFFAVTGDLLSIRSVFDRAIVSRDGIEVHRHDVFGSRFVDWDRVVGVEIVPEAHDESCFAMVLEEPDLRTWRVPCSTSTSRLDPDLLRLEDLFRDARSARPMSPPQPGAAGGRVRVVGHGDLISASPIVAVGPLFPLFFLAHTVGHAIGDVFGTVADLTAGGLIAATVALMWGGSAVEADATGITLHGRFRRHFLPWSEIIAIEARNLYDAPPQGDPVCPFVFSLRDGSKVGAPLMVSINPRVFTEVMIERLLTVRPAGSPSGG